MNKLNKGITLIALVITIIILLILAGVTINVLIGDNGLFNTAKKATDDYKKAEIKEEIEVVLIDIKAEELAKGNELTLNKLKEELQNKLPNITVEENDPILSGTYKDYNFIINENYEVIIAKPTAIPQISYTLSDETEDIAETTITLTATVEEGTITKIIKPDGTYAENVGETTYKVTANGKYTFIVETSEGVSIPKTIRVRNLKVSAPIIESATKYYTLTANGVIGPLVTITYEENERYNKIYSEDNGTTWIPYTGPFKANADTIIARSVSKTDETDFIQASQTILNSDALGKAVHDNNEDSAIAGAFTRKSLIDSSAWGKNMYVKYALRRGTSGGSIRLDFFDSEGKSLGGESDSVPGDKFAYDDWFHRNWTLVIPDGTVSVSFSTTNGTQYSGIRETHLYEVRVEK